MSAIGFYSIDEVNQSIAHQLAERCGVRLQCLSPKDPPPNGQYAAVVYDLDAFSLPHRHQILTSLLSETSDAVVACHSYDLKSEEITALRRCGVVVTRRLGQCLFRKLLAILTEPGEPDGQVDE